MGAGNSSEADPSTFKGPEVTLNIYEPGEGQKSVMGLGIYHSGIEIGGLEYAYAGGSVSGSGVYSQPPKENPPGSQWIYKESVILGNSKLDRLKTIAMIDKLRASPKFSADNYDIMANNCNNFTTDVAIALGLGANYPSYVNRAASLVSMFRGGNTTNEPVEDSKPSVFGSTKGRSLNDEDEQKSQKKDAKTNSGVRHNPWRDPNFKPPTTGTSNDA